MLPEIETAELSKHTWFKIGGEADIVVPETREQLIEILEWCQDTDRDYRILGNGSNVLVNDEGINELVIKTTKCCTELSTEGTRITAGASILLPQLVKFAVDHNLGGIEYLYSVPGTVGGAICMNAGRGRPHGKQISNHVTSVEVFDGTEVRSLSTDELNFAYRYSILQDRPDWVVLSATIDLNQQDYELGRTKMEERMQHAHQRERSLPNAGSVFKEGQSLSVTGWNIGDAKFVSQYRICNTGNATFRQVYLLTKTVYWLNKLHPFKSEPKIEIRIWK